MPKRLLPLLLAAFCAPLAAQSLEPGEWEIDSTVTSKVLPKPQAITLKRCIRQEDADNPERILARQGQKNDCTVTVNEKSATGMKWQMACPKSGMSGTGTARLTGSTLDSEMKMRGELQGRQFEMLTKMTGRRVGPCPS